MGRGKDRIMGTFKCEKGRTFNFVLRKDGSTYECRKQFFCMHCGDALAADNMHTGVRTGDNGRVLEGGEMVDVTDEEALYIIAERLEEKEAKQARTHPGWISLMSCACLAISGWQVPHILDTVVQ